MTDVTVDKSAAISARLYVLYSKQSNTAVILRKGPSKWTLSLGWDLKYDTFAKGQWLAGKIYNNKCDISPDGKHWIYFAYKKDPYTVVAKVPYLKALHYLEDNTTWFGGGYFIDSHHVNLQTGPKLPQEREINGLKISHISHNPLSQNSILVNYLKRNDWKIIELKRWDEGSVFRLGIYKQWELRLIAAHGTGRRDDGAMQLQSYELIHIKSSMKIDVSTWEWADYDPLNDRVIWAEMGKIMTAKLIVLDDGKPALSEEKCLLDTNDMQFEELIAPY